MKCCPYLSMFRVNFFRQVISWALQHLQWELWEVTKALWTLKMRVLFQDGKSFLQLRTHILEWFVLLQKNGTLITRDRMNFEKVSESLSFIHMWFPKFMALLSSHYFWFWCWCSVQFLYKYQASIWAPAIVYNCLASSLVLFQACIVCCIFFAYFKFTISVPIQSYSTKPDSCLRIVSVCCHSYDTVGVQLKI